LVVELLASPAVLRAFDRAASMGVKVFGASVSDFDTAVLACKSGCYKYLQFPFNASNRSFAPIFEILAAHDMNAIVNRPFAMGALVQGDVEKSATKSFRSILDMGFSGIVLTGTSSVAHLLNNIKAFEKEIIRCG
jgi:aryl-alcohol dehydrogenase-like predicted oxidoreductase